MLILYMDLDNFKPVNDLYGHDAGDQVLKSFSERLRASIRASDTAARIGGDEFAVLLINAGPEDAQLKAQMFTQDVEKLRFGDASAPLGFGLS